MRRIAILVSVLFVASLSAAAQDLPKADLFVGYTFSHFDTSDSNTGNTNGWNVTPSFYFFKFLGLSADIGGGHAGGYTQSNGSHVDAPIDTAHFLFGPRIRFGTRHFTPFAEFLIGGVARREVTNSAEFTDAATNDPVPANTELSPSQFNLAIGASGGFDYGLAHHLALRAQYNWLHTDYTVSNTAIADPSSSNNGVSVGIVIR
jgi:opacity protein-like surface antigen